MTLDNLEPKYDPNNVESGRYQQWLHDDVFKPSDDPSAKPYSIVIPPPNVTGKLHLGHAWDVTLQDIIVRQKRMQGFDTLWLPGMDHAGIATQAKVEQKLRNEGITRQELGREKFINQVWEWKDEYAATIHEQWAKMGISVDYSRERFTLDKSMNEAVNRVFVTLYEKGLIYRGEYIVNWDPVAKTAISDIEVIHKDIPGNFYNLKYEFTDGSGSVEVATTRPETIFGDVALAVHPDDSRFKDIVGKTVTVPLLGKEIPIISDYYVDQEKGSGIVKITPAHDPNDFQVGNRHDLPRVNIMNEDATLNEKTGKYNGLDRFEARKAIIKELESVGALISVDENIHPVGHSERTNAVVEPRLSTQWFVKMEELAKKAIDNQATDDRVNFVPSRFESTFTQWMENAHDWVISRQLWWGHQIPVWYHKETGEMFVSMTEPLDAENWERDPDVLDTWFSSALWPFATMGWPDETSYDYKRYFPTNTLVTGYDIIFFWVSRMIFQSLEFTEKVPFQNVLIHGLIRDEQGRKMSKSLGNGIDPMEVIDKYGADSLRWFLTTGSTPGQDTRFSYTKVESAWNFINKIWNASRFVLMNIGDTTIPDHVPLENEMDLTDKYILSKLNHTVAEVTRLMDKFEFGEVGRELYNFIWNDFCDWYIELSKDVLKDDTKAAQNKKYNLAYVLDNILRLIHPIMPFVSEKIWQSMPHVGPSISVADYPVVHDELNNPDAVKEMNIIIDIIKSVRTIRAELNIGFSKDIELILKVNDINAAVIKDNQHFLQGMTNAKSITFGQDVEVPDTVKTVVNPGSEVFIPIGELIDLDAEIDKLTKQSIKFDQEIERLNRKLNNQGFIAKAPKDVVAEQKTKLEDYTKQKAATEARITELSAKK